MDSFITFLQQNPLYIFGLVLLVIFIVISLIKKAVKLAVLAVILFIAYGYFLNGSYQSSQSTLELIEDKVKTLTD